MCSIAVTVPPCGVSTSKRIASIGMRPGEVLSDATPKIPGFFDAFRRVDERMSGRKCLVDILARSYEMLPSAISARTLQLRDMQDGRSNGRDDYFMLTIECEDLVD